MEPIFAIVIVVYIASDKRVKFLSCFSYVTIATLSNLVYLRYSEAQGFSAIRVAYHMLCPSSIK